jgi:hypothetical protein
MIENEIRTERGGPEVKHYRVVINHGPDFGTEYQTGRHFPTRMAAIFFCSGTDEAEKQARRELVAEYRKATGTPRGQTFRWTVLEYVPTKIDGRPLPNGNLYGHTGAESLG